MLGHQQTEPSQRLAGEHPGNHRSDRMPPEPAQSVVQHFRVVSEKGRGLVFSGVPNVREEKGRMRPARQQRKSQDKPERAGITKNDDSAGRVAVHTTLPVALAGDVAVGTTSLVDFAGSTSLEVGFPAVAEGTSLADCAGVASPVVGAKAGPSTVAEVASLADIAGAAPLPLLSWRHWPTLLERRLRPLLGWRPWPLLGRRPRPTLLEWHPRPLLRWHPRPMVLGWRPRLTWWEMCTSP